MNLNDIVVEGIWEGLAQQPLTYAVREENYIEIGDTDIFNMAHVAAHVIRKMQSEGAVLVRNDWREHMRTMLGKQVIVTISTEPELTQVRGQLLTFDEGGDVGLRCDDGFIHYAWPNLSTELA